MYICFSLTILENTYSDRMWHFALRYSWILNFFSTSFKREEMPTNGNSDHNCDIFQFRYFFWVVPSILKRRHSGKYVLWHFSFLRFLFKLFKREEMPTNGNSDHNCDIFQFRYFFWVVPSILKRRHNGKYVLWHFSF